MTNKFPNLPQNGMDKINRVQPEMGHYGRSILISGIQTTTRHHTAKPIANNITNHN